MLPLLQRKKDVLLFAGHVSKDRQTAAPYTAASSATMPCNLRHPPVPSTFQLGMDPLHVLPDTNSLTKVTACLKLVDKSAGGLLAQCT
jgi:hypothetical protein